MSKNNSEKINTSFPVISVVGHVDHGKTTLLDAIRKSSEAQKEKGGITQSIGASEVEITHDNNKRSLTFIDTPGHEAFANMRAQGVTASDIVLLVVAADDGIKPQTKESIEKIKESKIPFIVVITKTDTTGANVEKVKKEILNEGILLEGLGGDVPYISVAAPKGKNITELLDLIALVYDVTGIEKNSDASFLGVVIDAKQDKKQGTTATVIIKQGKLKIKDEVFTKEKNVGKIRALTDPTGTRIQEAYPGKAVEVLGLTEILPSGTTLFSKQQESSNTNQVKNDKNPIDLLKLLKEQGEEKMQIVLKTQTSAELDAVKNALPKNIKIASEGQGEITTSDILLAKDTGALVVGFNSKADSQAKSLAESEKVFYKSYDIIYELIDEISDASALMSEEEGEKELGVAKILAKFGEDNIPIIGFQVQKGRIALGDNVRIIRDDKVLGSAKISSLKRGKAEVKEVAKDLEAGLKLDQPIDFIIGDAIIAYK